MCRQIPRIKFCSQDSYIIPANEPRRKKGHDDVETSVHLSTPSCTSTTREASLMNLRSKNALVFYLNDFQSWSISNWFLGSFGYLSTPFIVSEKCLNFSKYLLATAKSRTHHWTMWETETIVTKILKKTMGKLLTRHSNLILLFFRERSREKPKKQTHSKDYETVINDHLEP